MPQKRLWPQAARGQRRSEEARLPARQARAVTMMIMTMMSDDDEDDDDDVDVDDGEGCR